MARVELLDEETIELLRHDPQRAFVVLTRSVTDVLEVEKLLERRLETDDNDGPLLVRQVLLDTIQRGLFGFSSIGLPS